MKTDATRRPGRPPNPNRKEVPSFESPLYLFLQARLANHVNGDGQLNVRSLSGAIEISHQNLYKRLSQNNLSPALASKIVAESKGAMALEDLHPFVFN